MSLDYKQVWRDLHSAKQIRAHHIVQYFILKAIEKYKDDPAFIRKAPSYVNHKLSKAFTPVTRQKKLDNGKTDFGQLKDALYWANPKMYVRILEQKPEDLLSKEYLALYHEVHRQLTIEKFKEYYTREYVYIFVRQDISPEYQSVQAAHATLKAGWHFRDFNMDEKRMNGLYFTLVGVPNLDALCELKTQNKVSIPFFEPDLNDQMTALVLPPVLARKRGKLLAHKLLVFSPGTNPTSLTENK